MVRFARLPWPRALPPLFIPIRRAIGPLTMTNGPENQVVANRPCMLNSSVQAASTAARTTGRYSGRHPAMTALTATFSTVHSTRSGRHHGDDLVRRPGRALQHAQDAGLGGRHDGQAVGPTPVEERLELVLQGGQLDPAAVQRRCR